jgi:carbon-monoxide dehydrogenase large subunit
MVEFSVVGKSVPRVDAWEKVTGKARYSADLRLPGMLYAKILRSPYPHARILRVDTTKGKEMPGVRAFVTGKDVPEERVGYIRDRYILARDRVRFIGEAVAAVAADSAEAAEEALGMIEVDYEELPAVFDAEEAIKSNPPVVIHPDLAQYARTPLPYPMYRSVPDLPNVYSSRQIRKGDTEKGFQEADLIIENHFFVPTAQHCCLERHNTLVKPEPDGGLTLWVSTHLLYSHKSELGRVLGLPPSRLRVISLYVGGAFGGKGVIVLPGIAGLLALKTGRPVKIELNRDEMFVEGNSREAMSVYIKDGVKRDGTLIAREMRLILNVGAYSGTTTLVIKNASFGAVGTYKVPNFKLDSYGVATNRPPTGPYRGFGSTEVIWAIESQMDMIAEELEIDPVELRRKNLLVEGEEDATGMVTHSIGARACLDAVSKWIGEGQESSDEKGPWRIGKGVALCNKYTMPGTRSDVQVKVHPDGVVEVRHSVNEVGQGCNTILAQIAAEEFSTSMDKIKIVFTDTAITPFEMGTVSSRSTFHTGNALRLACQDAKRQIFHIASEKLGISVESLEIKEGVIFDQEGKKKIRIGDLFSPAGYLLKGGEILGNGTFTGPLESEDAETGQGKRTVTYYAHGATAVEVKVNVETGEIGVLRMGSCFDMGQPINPKLCESQIEGGSGMGMGNALFEEIVFERGAVANPNFLDYKFPTSLDMPLIKDMESMIEPAPHQEGPYGAKGFAEGGLIAVAPAIGNAVCKATGARIRDLPITREKILNALRSMTWPKNEE